MSDWRYVLNGGDFGRFNGIVNRWLDSYISAARVYGQRFTASALTQPREGKGYKVGQN